ncbi:MAG: hypothetical protein JSR77_10450 [Planctomycetes bacterium]|nr:hypothetical protein [Planctomycetota bacterium]
MANALDDDPLSPLSVPWKLNAGPWRPTVMPVERPYLPHGYDSENIAVLGSWVSIDRLGFQAAWVRVVRAEGRTLLLMDVMRVGSNGLPAEPDPDSKVELRTVQELGAAVRAAGSR